MREEEKREIEEERGREERDWPPVGLVLSYRNNESHVATTCPVLSLLLLSALPTGRLCLYSIEPAVLVLARMLFTGH